MENFPDRYHPGVIPYAYAVSLLSIEPKALWNSGFRGMIVDVDNTLIGFDTDEVEEEVRLWIDQAKACGFRIVFLSNNFHARVTQVSTALDCPAIPNALKPLPFGFLQALKQLATPRSQTIIVGDQLVTDILGGYFLGIQGILVNPIAQKDFPLTRIFRFIERCVIGSRRPSI